MTEVVREIEMLRGIAAGVALDYKLTDGEIRSLGQWVASHEYIMNVFPLSELQDLLNRLATGNADGDPREELLDWCFQFASPESAGILAETSAIRRLHGVLSGIAADGVVTQQELIDLQDWLRDYQVFANIWPFDMVIETVSRILSDGHLDPGEEAEMLAICKDLGGEFQFGAIVDEPVCRHAVSRAPVYSTLDGVCDSDPIVVEGRRFCFTGSAKSGKREELARITMAAGGIPVDRVDPSLDYLVVGGLSNPAWAFASYGRKIEKALTLRRDGYRTRIVREASLLDALGTGS